MTQDRKIKLKGFSFQEIFTSSGLERLDKCFLTALRQENEALYHFLLAYREQEPPPSPLKSQKLIECAEFLDGFMADFFAIQEEINALKAQSERESLIPRFKKEYVLKEAKHRLSSWSGIPAFPSLTSWLESEIQKYALPLSDWEWSTAKLGAIYQLTPEAPERMLLIEWCIAALLTPEGQSFVKGWTSFRLPQNWTIAS